MEIIWFTIYDLRSAIYGILYQSSLGLGRVKQRILCSHDHIIVHWYMCPILMKINCNCLGEREIGT